MAMAATPTNIDSGFHVSGIWPINRNAFTSQGYLPSTVTDRNIPVVTEEVPEPVMEEIIEDDAGNPTPNRPLVLNNLDQPTPAASASLPEFVSPQQLNVAFQRLVRPVVLF